MENIDLQELTRQAHQVEAGASRIMEVLNSLEATNSAEKTQMAWQAMSRAVHSLFAGGNDGWLSEQGFRENLDRFNTLMRSLDQCCRHLESQSNNTRQ